MIRRTAKLWMLVALTIALGAAPSSAPALDFPAGPGPYSVAVADFNGDGKLDLVVANDGSYTVAVLLGNGDGTFQPAQFYPAGGGGPKWIVVADLNGDGKLDMAVANGSSNVGILLGNGDGTFQPVLMYGTAGSATQSVGVGDFNGDGKPDLVVANFSTNNVAILLGNGDGTFQAAQEIQNFGAGTYPIGIIVADFNGDGRVDFAVANIAANTVAVFLGNGDGTFQPAQTYRVASDPESIAVGDFNGDGKLDLAVASDYPGASVSVLLGNGDGTFQPAQFYPVAGDNSESVITADFNGDGRLDLAVANEHSDNVSVLLGNGDGTFQPAQTFPAGAGPEFVATGDFNGDGKLDLAVANRVSNTVSVLFGNGDGTFSPNPPTAAPVLTPPGGTFNASVQVTITDGTAGAAIYYTTDGSTPTTSSTPYSAPIVVNQTMTIRAIAAARGFAPSAVATATYTILQPAPAPTFSPPAGTYAGSQTVTISDSTSGATIYYTTDGSTPTTSSTRYTGPIAVNQSITIRAIATAPGFAPSGVATAIYTIQQQPASTPTFSPSGGTYTGSQTVTLSDSTSGASIFYTTDGSTPTTSSTGYTGPIAVTQSMTIKAIATAPGFVPSTVASAVYTLRATPPTFSPAAGTYNQPLTATLSDSTSGASIFYTTDGSTPTTSSPRYTGPISVTRTTTIKAIATAPGFTPSTVATATYVLQAATPTFNPPGGSYLLPQQVTISDASPGVTIYYTTDGSTPTTSSPRYTGPILLLTTTTIKAIAVAPGWSQSPVATATYRFLLL